MCPPRRPKPNPPPRTYRATGSERGNNYQAVQSPPPSRVDPPAPTPPSPSPAPTEPAPKMRTIGRTSAGTTVSGQQTTSTAAPSRRRKQTSRMGRRAGTRSLRISRNPNTGQGDLLY